MKNTTQRSITINANKWLIFILLLFVLPTAKASNYYWVNGQGTWLGILNRWATTSGGTTYYSTPPTATDDVFIDANSLSVGDTLLHVDGGICHNLTISNTNVTWIFGGNTFTIYGSLIINNYIPKFESLINFVSGTSGNHIKTSGTPLIGFIKFDNPAGEWILDDDFSTVGSSLAYTGRIILLNGIIRTNNFRIDCGEFHVGDTTGGIISSLQCYLGTSEIHAGYVYLRDPGVPYTLSADSASFYLVGDYNTQYSTGVFYCSLVNRNFSKIIGVPSIFASSYTTTASVNFCHIDQITVETFNGTGDTIRELNTIQVSGAYPSISSNPVFSHIERLNFIKTPGSSNGGGGIYTDSLMTFSIDTLNIDSSAGAMSFNPGDTVFVNNEFLVQPRNTMLTLITYGSQPGYLSKNSGMLCLDSLIIKNIHVIGGAQFFAGNNSVDQGGNSGWQFTSCVNISDSSYYWVGGTGDWNDTTHWATASGGGTFYSLPPGLDNDVFFDANSFSSSNDTVYVNPSHTKIYCREFNWSAIQNPSTFYLTNTSTLKVKGSFYLNTNLDFSFDGKLFLYGDDSIKFMDFSGLPLSGPISTGFDDQLIINGHSSWNLLSDLTCNSMKLQNGTLNTNNNNLTVFGKAKVNILSATDTCRFNLGTSKISIGKELSVTTSNIVHVDADSATLVFDRNIAPGLPATSDFYMDLNATYKNVTFSDDGFIYGGSSGTPVKIRKLNVFKDLSVPGGLIVDTLFLNNSGYHFIFGYVNISMQLYASVPAFAPNIALTGGTLYKSNGTLCLQNLSLSNVIATGGAQFYAGTGCVDLGGNFGWSFSTCSIMSDVWPGDANYDLSVSNVDVLNIGLAYNETGSLRTGASINWLAQPTADWSGYFISAVNHKHADTNGDGTVNDDDTLAISQNYGLIHPARMAAPSSVFSINDPLLYLVVNPDSVNLSDTVYIETFYGTAQLPVDSVYGLAFSINYDTALVDTSWIDIQFLNSWMGTPGSDLLTFSKSIPINGRIDYAIVRNDHINASGFGGPICRTGIIIVDNVAGRQIMPITISNPYAITAYEYELGVNLGIDSVSIDTTALVGIQQNMLSHFELTPNPANEFILLKNIESSSRIEIYDVQGQVVLSENTSGADRNKLIDIRPLSKGVYAIRIFNKEKIMIGKLTKI